MCNTVLNYNIRRYSLDQDFPPTAGHDRVSDEQRAGKICRISQRGEQDLAGTHPRSNPYQTGRTIAAVEVREGDWASDRRADDDRYASDLLPLGARIEERQTQDGESEGRPTEA